MAATDEQTEAFVNGLLKPEPEPEIEDTETKEGTVEAPENEPTEAETADEDVEADEEDTSTDDEDDTDEAGQEEQSTFTVKVDGEDVAVTLDDLKRAYSGQAYIQKGMQEAAEKRKQSEQLFSALQAEQQRFIETVQNIQRQGVLTEPTPPDITLLDKDPAAYNRATAKYNHAKREYDQQQSQIQAAQQRHAQMQSVAQQQYVQEQSQVLLQHIPEFGDAEKAPELMAKLRQVGQADYGYTEDELNAVVDSRAVRVLHDAMKWRELQSGTAKAKAKPKPPKNVKPAARRVETEADARKKLRQQAKKSDRPEDWAQLLLSGE